MPTKFSDFFKLDAAAEPVQTRIYTAIGDATSIMEVYGFIYRYIIGGLRIRSQHARQQYMDASVVIDGPNQLQMEDAEKYFEEGEVEEWENRVRFEYLEMAAQDESLYGPNVYILRFDKNFGTRPQFACRQVELYLQIETYNEEYDDQCKYYKDHPTVLKPPPNGKFAFDPKDANTRVNPDDTTRVAVLHRYAAELKQWIYDNYPDVKKLLAAKTGSEFFDVIFFPGNDYLTLSGLRSTLNSIRDLKDSRPAVKKPFRESIWDALQAKETFWNDTKISNGYADIKKIGKRANNKIYGHFMRLFEDFLSPNTYSGEKDPITRKANAMSYITSMFSTFLKSQPSNGRFETMVISALNKVKKSYPERYTDYLDFAEDDIDTNDEVETVISEDLAYSIKDKADEVLSTLPLLVNGARVSFFTVQNFVDLEAMNNKSVILPNQSRSSVIVPGDPDENNSPRYRPIYRSGFRIENFKTRAIAFGNLPSTPGVFYYRTVENPSELKVTLTSGRKLTIDFQKYTIYYDKKKNGRFKNDNGDLYVEEGSTNVFFNELRQTTKWKDIKGVRRYDPYYSTVPTDLTEADPHLTAYVAAARGAPRALPILDENLCLWFWAFEDKASRPAYDKLGAALGLPTKREISVKGVTGIANLLRERKPCQVLIGGAQYTYTNYGARQFNSKGFYYSVIGIKQKTKDEVFYVRVNGPSPSVADVLRSDTIKNKSRPLADDPKNILALFNFAYYRRVTSEIDASSQEPRFTQSSKVIQLYSKKDKRKPKGSGVVVIQWPADDSVDAIGANLPICFNVKDNVIRYFMDKQSRGKMINKGNSLYRERGARQDAGTAMNPIFKKLIPPLSTQLTSTKVPATAFANGAIRQSPAVQGDWGTLKVASSNYFPINQEWCHLRGHGDGGDEYPGNFVSGSYHCNSEQLAIETGQRLVTQQSTANSYALYTTAYMLRDATDYSASDNKAKSQVLTDNYLKNQTAYWEMLKSHTAQKGTQPPTKKVKYDPTVIAQPKLEQGAVAPLAAYIRYKVMLRKASGQGALKRNGPDSLNLLKSFDFIFEGQSEFIDVLQFSMISRAVQFALAGGDALKQWYEQRKQELSGKTTK